MKKNVIAILTVTALLLSSCYQGAPPRTNSEGEGKQFTAQKDSTQGRGLQVTPPKGLEGTLVRTTPVKDQGTSDLCWIYAMLATIESERLMLGDSVNLSTDFLARHYLEEQAERCYLLTNAAKKNGSEKITTRGMASMTLTLLHRYGMTHWNAYHLDANFDVVARKVEKTVTANRGKGLEKMNQALGDMLDETTRPLPRYVFMLGVEYTTLEFAYSVCMPDEYVALTSFTHHPYGKPFCLEVADNFYQDEFLNIPLDSMMNSIDRALMNGHPVCWEGDISEPGFSWKKGIAKTQNTEAYDAANRQKAFEQGETTDDHCMELIGIKRTPKGGKYYLAKNSWGEDNALGGYMYLSENYLRMKTIAVWMTHEAYEQKNTSKQP